MANRSHLYSSLALNQLGVRRPLSPNSSSPAEFWGAPFICTRCRPRRMGLAWSCPTSLLRVFCIVLPPLGVSLLSSAAGVFSSQIASAGEVLLFGPCVTTVIPGTVSATAADDFVGATNAEVATYIAFSAAYAQQCYNPMSAYNQSVRQVHRLHQLRLLNEAMSRLHLYAR